MGEEIWGASGYFHLDGTTVNQCADSYTDQCRVRNQKMQEVKEFIETW